MAQDYDEARPDVAEASERTLKDVQKMDAPNAKSVQVGSGRRPISRKARSSRAPSSSMNSSSKSFPRPMTNSCAANASLSGTGAKLAKEMNGVKICRDCNDL